MSRIRSGKHCEIKVVDLDEHRKRYYKSSNNIKRLLEICDILHVYDNTFEPIRIIRKHKGELSIFPNELWSEDKIIELLGEKI